MDAAGSSGLFWSAWCESWSALSTYWLFPQHMGAASGGLMPRIHSGNKHISLFWCERKQSSCLTDKDNQHLFSMLHQISRFVALKLARADDQWQPAPCLLMRTVIWVLIFCTVLLRCDINGGARRSEFHFKVKKTVEDEQRFVRVRRKSPTAGWAEALLWIKQPVSAVTFHLETLLISDTSQQSVHWLMNSCVFKSPEHYSGYIWRF